jgi:hypothetical protein
MNAGVDKAGDRRTGTSPLKCEVAEISWLGKAMALRPAVGEPLFSGREDHAYTPGVGFSVGLGRDRRVCDDPWLRLCGYGINGTAHRWRCAGGTACSTGPNAAAAGSRNPARDSAPRPCRSRSGKGRIADRRGCRGCCSGWPIELACRLAGTYARISPSCGKRVRQGPGCCRCASLQRATEPRSAEVVFAGKLRPGAVRRQGWRRQGFRGPGRRGCTQWRSPQTPAARGRWD